MTEFTFILQSLYGRARLAGEKSSLKKSAAMA
jgi:hypothetical protein